jgi:hypothetical protein
MLHLKVYSNSLLSLSPLSFYFYVMHQWSITIGSESYSAKDNAIDLNKDSDQALELNKDSSS